MSTITRIAVVTDDGRRISDHFGRARYYQVFTVDNGTITSDELRDRHGTLHHGHDHGHDHSHENGHHSGGHGFHEGAPDRHTTMISQITDVSLLITRGMGRGAFIALAEAGIETAATALVDTREAVQAYIDGSLQVDQDRIH